MAKRRLRVYIAGPMTNGTRGCFNMGKVHEAIRAYLTLIDLGLVPFCPQLSVFCEFMCPGQISYDRWLELDFQHIDDSDFVLRLPGPSSGADSECKYARSMGLSVIEGLDAFLDFLKEISYEAPATDSIT